MKASFFRLLPPAFAAALILGCTAPGPAATVEKFYHRLEEGRIEDAAEMFSKKSIDTLGVEKLKEALRTGTKQIAEQGGIESFEIVEVNEIGEVAEVEVKIEYGDGTTETEEISLIQEDGEWKIEFAK